MNIDFVELNRKLEKFENRFELCLRATKLARESIKQSLYDEDGGNPTIRVLETVVARLDQGSVPSDRESALSDQEPELSDQESGPSDQDLEVSDQESEVSDQESELSDQESELPDQE